MALLAVHLAAQGAGVPAPWTAAWNAPPNECRPLQIVHGIRPKALAPGAESDAQALARAVADALGAYRDLGVGGVVCNVAFKDYLRSEPEWAVLCAGIAACAELGMPAWIYDEDGYPSGAAGGLVLAANPAFEAAELVFDAAAAEPFTLRPSYECTHASNNFYAARRYANLLDDRATKAFIAVTHEAYAHRLGPALGRTVKAFFTDEPSLLAVDTGQLGEDVRKKVRVQDPVDARVASVPRVPWCYDLAECYARRHGEDLTARRRALFGGDAAADRETRRRFWALVADLVAERYFGALGAWCEAHGVASSGHVLWEEEVLHHVALMGNALKCLAAMQIPGLDVLSSDPEAVVWSGWVTACLPESAALLMGRRRVMTEVSDFLQSMGGASASLAEMQATAAWQAAWGVTEFTLYYTPTARPPEAYRDYCTYVGRLNAILRDATPVPNVALYYPIYDLWAEYVPVAGRLTLKSQSPRAQRLVGAFMEAGQALGHRQIPFVAVDHEKLAGAAVKERAFVAGGHAFETLVVPDDSELPPGAQRVVAAFAATGGRVVRVRQGAAAAAVAPIPAPYALAPASDRIVLGVFERDGASIALAVNVGKNDYQGACTAPAGRTWSVLDPASGAVAKVALERGAVPLALKARQAVLLVGTGD
jgi:hypothetical protein